MKNIFKSMALLALVAGFASCNNVAEFKTESFVAFSGSKYTVKEDAKSIKIPVNLIAEGSKTTTITYEIVGGNAVEGKHYTMPNKTGVITVSTDPAKCDSIEVCPIDSTGVLTKNKTITFKLNAVVEDGIYLGPTTECTLTIIDIDGGINLLVGNWSGSGLASSKNPASIDMTIDTCDPTEDYPTANLKITAMSLTDPVGNGWDAQIELYAHFNDDNSTFEIFPMQVFDAGNFGDDIGVLYIALDVVATLKGTSEDPVVFAVNEGVMTLNDDTYCGLWNEDMEFSGYTCGYIKAGAELRKNE